MSDASEKARALVEQHSVTAALRIAAETAQTFPKRSKGREFWMEVTQLIEDSKNGAVKQKMYRGSALDKQE
jgi:hypothetical protein